MKAIDTICNYGVALAFVLLAVWVVLEMLAVQA